MAELHFAPEQNYDCVMCAKGCTEKWQVHVNPSAAKVVLKTERGLQLQQRVIQRLGADQGGSLEGGGGSPTLGQGFEFFPEAEDGGRVVGRVGTRCVFLGDDKLCDIHREFGVEDKPISCRQFPFTAVNTPDGTFVGVTYFCTSAQQNSGRPLPEHRGEVEAILAAVQVPMIGDKPFTVAHEATLDWETYKGLEAKVAAKVTSAGPLLAFAHLFRVLSQALQDLNESGAVTAGMVQNLWNSVPAHDLARDPFLSGQLDFYLGALVGVTEVGKDLAHRDICNALVEGLTCRLPRVGGDIDLKAAAAQRAAVEEKFGAEIRRYYLGLLHRKFLVDKRPMLDNAIFGYMMQRFLVLYTAAFAQLRDPQGSLELQDFYKALDLLEADVVTHAGGLEKLISIYADATHRCLCLG